MDISEPARAKINLTLTVLGRRPDGYHELESVVTFASAGDRVTLQPGTEAVVATTGPFAGQIAGQNLLEKTLRLLGDRHPELRLGTVRLEKNLPVAAGLGGGSADAAALLRAVRRANPHSAERVDWLQAAAMLGADVPVCLADRPALMRGIGDQIEALALAPGAADVPNLPAVLVNPGLPLATSQVFAALHAGPAPAGRRPSSAPLTVFDDLLDLMGRRGNDLERPAIALLPVVGDVKSALAAQAGCRIAALSGSGPTCFGLFASTTDARAAARALASAHPGWWVVPTSLDWPG